MLQLVVDSLRYWVTEMHVDGFRFDLAPALARASPAFDAVAPFFAVLRQDPVLSPRLLIAEPWDLGEGGYQVGHFPPGWIEWNDQYRDTMRAYWKGDGGLIGDFARRLTGSHDLFGHNERGPCASVNFVTAHDGFTLNDRCRTTSKHNEANGEDNRDGNNNNLSWNCGVEGPTDDPQITALRERQKRNFLATLLLSQGVPMLLAGDEVGRTQQGNNNAYCQDNEINWHDWAWDDAKWRLLNFAKKVIRLRRAHPIFRRRGFFHGVPIGGGRKDVAWLKPDGQEMTLEEWEKDHARCLGMWLNGEQLPETDAARPPAARRELPGALQRAPRRDRLPAPRPAWGRHMAGRDRHHARDGRAARDHGRPQRVLSAARTLAGPAAPGRGRRGDVKRVHAMPFGAECHGDTTRFRLWAPACASVCLELAAPNGACCRCNAARTVGTRSRCRARAAGDALCATASTTAPWCPILPRAAIPTTCTRPARSSTRRAFDWDDADWRGRPWHEAVVYELHVGTFTPEGTFAAARRSASPSSPSSA